jgi:bifunctional UDP-N-acetylglucosamine pyrophosphorylase / glucosamine-1-phosphate N-acetyltransferase
MTLTAIVLAAGAGTRMRSPLPKVLHRVGGRSMVGHVLEAVRGAGADRIVVVVGHGREEVGPHVLELVPGAVLAVQEEQLGTAHAVRIALDAAGIDGAAEGTVLVAYGDTPLLEADSLRALVADHRAAGRAVSILSGVVADPFGYGRIVRDAAGDVVAIVEEKDATEEQRAIREINSGILALDAAYLAGALPRIGNDNAKGEYYLTDLVGLAHQDGRPVGAYVLDDVMQTEGANDPEQLAALEAEYLRRTRA